MAIDVEGLTKNKNMKMTDKEVKKAVKDYFYKLERETKKHRNQYKYFFHLFSFVNTVLSNNF